MQQDVLEYSLPDFADSFDLNLSFVRMVHRNPVLLQEGVSVGSVYGCFPNCLLNGGRTYLRDSYTRKEMEAVFSAFADYGVRPRLTLTNMLATEEHLGDAYVGDVLEVGAAYGAEAIVHSDFVADYVRERYGMKCILSTTRAVDNVDAFNRLAQRYDCVVLDYNANKNRGFINAITDKAKVEIMVNEYCAHGCSRRREHYLHNSKDQLDNTFTPFNCLSDNKFEVFLRHEPGDPVFFTDEEVARLHRETGIGHFKIVGRGVPSNIVLESYVYFLIKPEYRDDVKWVLAESAALTPAPVRL